MNNKQTNVDFKNITNVEQKYFIDIEKKNISINNNSDLCDISFTSLKCVLFYPCNHYSCCMKCTYKIIMTQKCPICRSVISLYL